VTINVHGVSEMTLQVRDLDEAEKWYTDNLDMPVSTRDLENGMVWLKAGEWTRIGLWLPGEREFGDRPGVHVHFALRVNKGELPGLKEQLEGKGLAVEGPVQWPGKEHSIYIRDPNGHLIEFFDYLPEKDTPQYAEQKAKYGDD